MSDSQVTRAIEAALKRTFPSPEYATLLQVRNTTAYAVRQLRTADALVFGLWPSRGLDLHGFEIKASKADLKRELLNPAKAEDVAQFCDFWWLAVKQGICDLADVPENWGVMELQGDKLVRIKPAVRLKAVPMTVPMVAGIMRNLSGVMVPASEVEAMVTERVNQRRNRLDSDLEWERSRHNELKQLVADFEKASGVKLERWPGGTKIGEAVKVVLGSDLNLHKQERDIEHTIAELDRIKSDLEKLKAELPKAAKQVDRAREQVA